MTPLDIAKSFVAAGVSGKLLILDFEAGSRIDGWTELKRSPSQGKHSGEAPDT